MNLPRRRNPFAFLLLLVLLVPILAACGGTAATPTTTTGPAETQATTAATEPETAETEAAETEETEAAEEPTEATTEEATEAPTDEAAGAAGGGEVSPAGSKILRLAYGAEPDTADPQRASFTNEIDFVMMNFQPLMTFDPETLQPVPGAAESVEVSEDGKTLTFTMRPDQQYSDGEPLTAENFEYAWKRLCDPVVAGDYTSIAFPVVGCEEYYTAFDTAGLTVTDEAQLQELRDAVGAEALDENTFQLTLKESAPYFLNVAALWVGAPTREDLVEAGGETWWTTPDTYIGNGPFRIVEWEPQSRVSWEPNENWALAEEKNLKLEGVDWTFIAEGQVAFEAYRGGELDMLGVGAEDLSTIEADPELKGQIVEQGSHCTFRLDFNNAIPPFDNQKVRQAFATALDREGWVRDVLQGIGRPAYSFIPPGIPGHDEDAEMYKYDPAKAKQLLTEAGFDFNQELKLPYSSSARNKTRYEYLASRLQEDLGVKITLDPVDRTAYTALTKSPETTPPMFILGWCLDYPDPQNWLSVVYETGGLSAADVSFSNAEFDALVSEADTLEIDDPRRAELYQQAQELLIELAPAAMFWHDINPIMVKPWVTGVNPSAVDPGFVGFYDMGEIDITTE